jgi:hypothetical protein
MKESNRRLFEQSKFVAFRTLAEAIPFNEEALELICSCLNFYVEFLTRSGKTEREIERVLALHKLEET